MKHAEHGNELYFLVSAVAPLVSGEREATRCVGTSVHGLPCIRCRFIREWRMEATRSVGTSVHVVTGEGGCEAVLESAGEREAAVAHENGPFTLAAASLKTNKARFTMSSIAPAGELG